MGSVKRLLDVYPYFLYLYDEEKIRRFMQVLKISSVEHIDSILEKERGDIGIAHPPKTTLGKLETIYFLRISHKTKEMIGKGKDPNVEITENPELMDLAHQKVMDAVYLFSEPEFLNEMI